MERLQSHRDFVTVLKRRRKAGGKDIVVHYLVPDDHHDDDDRTVHRRLGLAVSKSVGHAVTRNTVKRRFRVLARAHEDLLPAHLLHVKGKIVMINGRLRRARSADREGFCHGGA